MLAVLAALLIIIAFVLIILKVTVWAAAVLIVAGIGLAIWFLIRNRTGSRLP